MTFIGALVALFGARDAMGWGTGAVVGTVVGVGLLSGGLVPLVTALGFTKAGIAAGSAAAAIHSAAGPVIASKAAGGLVATCMSVGATGTVAAASTGAAVTLSVAGGTVAGVAAGSLKEAVAGNR